MDINVKTSASESRPQLLTKHDNPQKCGQSSPEILLQKEKSFLLNENIQGHVQSVKALYMRHREKALRTGTRMLPYTRFLVAAQYFLVSQGLDNDTVKQVIGLCKKRHNSLAKV